jgi:hypothetical protein
VFLRVGPVGFQRRKDLCDPIFFGHISKVIRDDVHPDEVLVIALEKKDPKPLVFPGKSFPQGAIYRINVN